MSQSDALMNALMDKTCQPFTCLKRAVKLKKQTEDPYLEVLVGKGMMTSSINYKASELLSIKEKLNFYLI